MHLWIPTPIPTSHTQHVQHSSAHLHMRLFADIRREAGRQGSFREVRLHRHQQRSPQSVGHTHRPLFLPQGSPGVRIGVRFRGATCLCFSRWPAYTSAGSSRYLYILSRIRRCWWRCVDVLYIVIVHVACFIQWLPFCGQLSERQGRTQASARSLGWLFAAPSPPGRSWEGCSYGPRLGSLAHREPAQV